jgi:hypothetical protein
MAKSIPSLAERVDSLRARYAELDEQSEQIIEEFVSNLAAETPGVPKDNLRQTEIDSRSRGYSYIAALRTLKEKLS